jgi:hypothetical protein
LEYLQIDCQKQMKRRVFDHLKQGIIHFNFSLVQVSLLLMWHEFSRFNSYISATNILMPFVSITRLRLRSILYLPSFMIHAMRSGNQAQKANGFMKGKTLMDKNLTFWTMTLWNDEADMKRYRIADAHKKAMPKLLNWCDEASIVNWHQPGTGYPEWQHAYERMKKEGRISKVLHPSTAHVTMDVPPPRYPSKTERILLPKS